jgi:hypothetical protein
MTKRSMGRRQFIGKVGAGAVGLSAANLFNTPTIGAAARPEYTGPNIILIRFGGGVRRRETIDPQHTYSPYFLHTLAKRGTLFTNMEISNLEGVDTSHGEGTLYLITGKYKAYTNVSTNIFGERFESEVPTLFEYLRKQYNVPAHQALIINNEDRTDEEFYSFSNHHLFGIEYRSNVLSLYRFKVYLLRRQLKENNLSDAEREDKQKTLADMEALDIRVKEPDAQSPEIQAFWKRWRTFYGDSGFVNPRGDRLLTELAERAIKELRPKLMMVNYTDPDYVHWGNPAHYTRGIATIDDGIRRLVETVEADEAYRDNTVFAIVPDCGRDTNRAMTIPFQHHFNSRSSHDIFGLFVGPGIAKGGVVDNVVDQISTTATLGQLMNVATKEVEGPVLDQVFA